MANRLLATTLGAVLLVLASGACIDPVHDSGVRALGGETAGIEEGPRHRAGQPCLTCHGGDGPSSVDLAVAGTVYATRTGATALEGVQVTVQDANGEKRVARTNDVGNFYIDKAEWSPTFPLFVRLDHDGKKKVMQTRIGQSGGCGSCHAGPRPKGNPAQMPPVFMEDL